MITAGDFIKTLQEISPTAYVILSKDSEGNRYSPLESLQEGIYVAKTTWLGDFYDDSDEPNEDDIDIDDGVYAVVLKPIV